MDLLAGIGLAVLLAWAYLLAGHGSFWRTDQRLPPAPDPPAWPAVVAVVPARDEADLLPRTLPSLLGQAYPGSFGVVLVDDASSDGTARVASSLAGPGGGLRVVRGVDPPPGWAGKVWAMARGMAEAGAPDYLLFTDADIVHPPESLAHLVRLAEARELDLVSQMARLRAETFWERAVVPAFVYFFAQLYPFRRVNRPGTRTAAAAGGCMLVRRDALEAAGGLPAIRGALIDDLALARLLKRRPGARGIWLGHGQGVASVRPHPRLADLWAMVARTAYTELRHSPPLLVATVAGLLLVYAGPPAVGLAGLAGLGSGGPAPLAAGAGLAAWALMAGSYVPTLRLYGLSPARALALPAVALLFAAMTVDSARRHHRGAGGAWKGRAGPFEDLRPSPPPGAGPGSAPGRAAPGTRGGAARPGAR